MSASAITTSRRSRAQKLHDGWLRTGDVFYKDEDGFFYFRSRVDDMFSCGGENVYPKEVENLLFTHPDVVNAVVAPVPHPVKGFVPAAMVIPRAGSRDHGRGAEGLLPRAGPAFRIRAISSIVDALPLNGAGKIDRGAVQAKLCSAYAETAQAVIVAPFAHNFCTAQRLRNVRTGIGIDTAEEKLASRPAQSAKHLFYNNFRQTPLLAEP